MTDEPNDTESKNDPAAAKTEKSSDTQAAEAAESKSESKPAEATDSKSESVSKDAAVESKDVAAKADSKSESKPAGESPPTSNPPDAAKSKDAKESKDVAALESKDVAAKGEAAHESKDVAAKGDSKDVAAVESKDVAAKADSKSESKPAGESPTSNPPDAAKSKDAKESKDVAALESKDVAAKGESKDVAAKGASNDVAAKSASKDAAKGASKDVTAKSASKDDAVDSKTDSKSDTRPSDGTVEVPHFVDPEDSYATDARRPTSDYRVIAIVLAIASIACLGYSAWSRHWLYNPHTRITAGEYGFGPRGMFRCALSGVCQEMSNRELADDFTAQIAEARHRAEYLPEGSNQDMQTMLWREATETADMLQTSPAFVPTAWIAFLSIIVTAASLLITLALALARKRVLLPIQPTTTALLGLIVGLVAGCVFVATKPGAAGFVGVSYGFWVFGAGTVLGLAAATLLNKHIRPLDLDLLEDSMDPEQF